MQELKLGVLTLVYLVVLCLIQLGAADQNGQSSTVLKENTKIALRKVCEQLCFEESANCPNECQMAIFQPLVSSDDIPSYDKRASRGIDGLTFDDYLFLRWLGRDMSRRRRVYK
ncbi:hypothetical protein MAR_019673 [Mya arenaria]|uniref:Uncharacterized protein n=1 Tax=Mya arenaria TaxID=6604 RepID=A0ABY7E542_MYAAR|nr:uncharacterized protein LOC128233899 [Mya arenaria]WAR04304.1 hypothetical protein MAR_019673 [Mya arenaria]